MRWAIALSLGLRQGEALALRWSDVDLEAGAVRIRWTRLRRVYAHGCDGSCGKRPGGHCPKRVRTNPEVGPTKSRAGKRTIGLPDQLVDLLRQHRTEQERERHEARQLWDEGNWVFADDRSAAQPDHGLPRVESSPAESGVREVRLHDARHTAATLLLALQVSERAAMGVMGWSSTAMAARHQQMTDPIREIAKRVGGLLWAVPDSASDEDESSDDDGLSGALVPA